FLKFFGENRYTLRTYFPQEVDSVQVNGNWQHDTVFHKVPPFSFQSQSGDVVGTDQLKDNMYVANFFFATCVGICKQMSSQLVRVQEAFRDEPQVKIVSFTVNPEHDSVEVLQQYADAYSANPKQWYFLTGQREKIYELAQKGFYLPVQQVPGMNDFIHSEKFLLVDKDQHVRGIYDGTDPEDVDRLITEIRILLHEYKSSQK
ncbi:MAG: SCO family protein, partial [Hymenobacteraceae bacterium]|nr:SCO family protein [Hymenobacteraceae bacterium]MDX5397262.1 SCO family protein [Hymenobacteraceae bacterium]MDX5443243.1 SCO family protein [Hymenobacteraceae bacterium]MDX5513340.1 SCO family protein [Hymenobacteraceae bacterium]